MHVVEITHPGAPAVLRLAERGLPVLGQGDVLIKVAASGVNRPDVLQRQGKYPAPIGASDLPGLEVAGVVVDGDALALAQFPKGTRVCALVNGGGYAEFCAVPATQCLPIPAGLTDVEAASLPETFFTVWSNVFDRAGLQSGETLLIQGGSSGIGVTAIQLARAAGARVIVTAGSVQKCEACLALGAHHAINYKTHDFVEEIARLTDGRGVNVILDMVAGDYIERELKCLAIDGRLAVIAIQGGSQSRLNVATLLQRRLTLTGSTLRPQSAAFKSAIAKSLRAQVWPWLEKKWVKPVIYQTFSATDAAQAHTLMESGEHIGKIVLTW